MGTSFPLCWRLEPEPLLLRIAILKLEFSTDLLSFLKSEK